MRLRHLIGAAALALLAGCSSFGTHEALEGQGNATAWNAHKARIATLDGWQIDGKVGIRAPKDSGSGTCSGCSARTTTTSACPARSAAAPRG